MALVKFGAGIVQMSGSIAGTTHARNRYGNYCRSKTKPTNPKSTGQNLVRSALADLVQRWHTTLDAAQRTAWNTYAAAVAMKNKLGEVCYLTGFNHYVRSNSNLLRLALPVVDDAPTELSLPEKDTTLAVTGSAATGNLSVVFANTQPWASEATGHLLVFMGTPQLVTRNFFDGPWKYAGRVNGNESTPPTSPATVTAPMTLVEGQKIWVYARIQRADGRVSEPFRASAIVGA